MAKSKFVVAVKDARGGGIILPGKVLGTYRKKEFAYKALPMLLRTNDIRDGWRVGIFVDGKLTS